MSKYTEEYISATKRAIRNIEILIKRSENDIERYQEIKIWYEKQLKE